MNYEEIAKYRKYPRGWTYVRGCFKERHVRLRGSGKIIGSLIKEMDKDGRVWWVVDDIKFQLLALAGDFVYAQFIKQQQQSTKR